MKPTLAIVLLGATLATPSSPHAQQPYNQVPCWSVPNGSNTTIQCQNGYWITTTPDGDTFTGNGLQDPSASAAGSSLVINPGTGTIDTTRGQTVAPPTQVLPMLAPYQAETYGFQPRQD